MIIVHYHSFENNYADLRLWTWDGYQARSPKNNDLRPVGHDDFGAIFHIDRSQYGLNGDCDRIGLIPRLGDDWRHKDGGDRFWTPTLGNEIYLVSQRQEIWNHKPDISPQIVAAYIDAPTRLAVKLSRPASAAEVQLHNITIADLAGTRYEPIESNLVLTKPGATRAFIFDVTTARPLDFFNNRYKVEVAGYAGAAEVTPRGLLDDRTHFFDPDAELGAVYHPGATTFRVFAPTARSVKLVLYSTPAGNQGRQLRPMRKAGKGIWELKLPGDWKGQFYNYEVETPGFSASHELLDPYATNAVMSSSRGLITDLATTNPPDWRRTKQGPSLASPVDMIIYEMHVRDFSIASSSGIKHKGLYLGFTEPGTHLKEDATLSTGIDHLVDLGITHVQLLPVQDFANDERVRAYNWGYITRAFNSPEGIYATDIADESRIRELKQLIAALHARGIGVIMDVVYNHTGDGASFFLICPGYYYRSLGDGNYSNGSGCGNEFRSEAPMGRKFIVDSLKYWTREFGIDGFRFDLMALMDVETMREIERELSAINPDIVLYGEPWTGGETPIQHPANKFTLAGTRIGAFNDNFRNALKGSPEGHGRGFIQDGSDREAVRQGITGTWHDWPDTPARSINYMTCHDNLVLIDKLKLSMPQATKAELKAAMKLGYLILFTSQGVPFIHGGEEFMRSKGGHHNSYEAPDSVNQVDWRLKQTHYDLFTYTRDLIALRKAHPLFRLRTKKEITARLSFEPNDQACIAFTVCGDGLAGESWKRACVVINPNAALSYDLPAGNWHLAFDHNGLSSRSQPVTHLKIPSKSGAILFEDAPRSD